MPSWSSRIRLTTTSYCRRWPLQARCVPYVCPSMLPRYHSMIAHTPCRLPGPLRRGHDQWRADAHHERHQEDAEPLLERELRYVGPHTRRCTCNPLIPAQAGQRRERPRGADLRPEEVQKEGPGLPRRHQRPHRLGHRPGCGWRRCVQLTMI